MSNIREQHCPRNVSIAGTKYLTPTLQGERVNFSLRFLPDYSPSLWGSKVKGAWLFTSHPHSGGEWNVCMLSRLSSAWFPDSIGVRSPCLGNGAAYSGLCLPIPVRQPSTATSTGQCKQSFPETWFQGDSGLYQVDRESYRRRYLARCSSFRLSAMFPCGARLVFVVFFHSFLLFLWELWNICLFFSFWNSTSLICWMAWKFNKTASRHRTVCVSGRGDALTQNVLVEKWETDTF